MIQSYAENVDISLSLHSATALPGLPSNAQRYASGPTTRQRALFPVHALPPAANTHPARRASSGPAAAPMRPPTTQTDHADRLHAAPPSPSTRPRRAGAAARAPPQRALLTRDQSRSIKGCPTGVAYGKVGREAPPRITPHKVLNGTIDALLRSAYTGPAISHTPPPLHCLQRVRRASLATRSYFPTERP
ncbi:hypothetical protein BJ912DRAFT_967833 [Pholiota molesta]|nr:hypothetical protein BJ912DRAFT_967833 [Pholiota molesta]